MISDTFLQVSEYIGINIVLGFVSVNISSVKMDEVFFSSKSSYTFSLSLLFQNVKEQNRHKLESQMSCDVMFFVGDKRESIGAHKQNLVGQSEVFRNMFNGPDVNKSEYDIPDISADYFWELLR